MQLKTQYRMHPDISAISNTLIYRGSLEDGKIKQQDGNYYPLSHIKYDEELLKWYRYDWGYDNPVLLVNTASAGAWVTSVSHGRRGSRLNFLSATICIDIAEKLLRDDRERLNPGEKHRILIICPYRPHANLLGLILREQEIENEIVAGTTHNFQGSEADVVILDLVNDEPHFRVGMFTPEYDDNTMCLLNVALTRAKRRLIIVGNFEYILKKSNKEAFIRAKLIPFLQKNYPCFDALKIVPAGLSARTAKMQSLILGGDIEPDMPRILVNQEHFYAILRNDLNSAKKQVVIYSAFITSDRLSQIGPAIRATVERGVQVYVVTKARGERNKRELPTYIMLEKTLENWRIVVIHKRGMHEKLIFIDDDILWVGSLNPLSFSNTEEIMERRKNLKIFSDYVKTLRLNELVGEYSDGSPVCPICGDEIVASEGGKDDPFYWRCVKEDCYSRNIDQLPLKGGIITCANCGESVEYGEWGGEPHWRCTEDRKHRQKIARTHLLLPKMRAIVPKSELHKLDKRFGISDSTIEQKKTQSSLF